MRRPSPAPRRLALSVVAELTGDRSAPAVAEALSWETRRIARRAAVLSLQAALFTVACLAVTLLLARRLAVRGAAVGLSLALRGVRFLASAVWAVECWAADPGPAAQAVNAFVADALERAVWCGLALWSAARAYPARLSLACLTLALGLGLLLVTAWDTVR